MAFIVWAGWQLLASKVVFPEVGLWKDLVETVWAKGSSSKVTSSCFFFLLISHTGVTGPHLVFWGILFHSPPVQNTWTSRSSTRPAHTLGNLKPHSMARLSRLVISTPPTLLSNTLIPIHITILISVFPSHAQALFSLLQPLQQPTSGLQSSYLPG